MNKPHWFPFYPNDFLGSSKVNLMTTEEIGAYTLLLCYQWNDPKCTIPADEESIKKLTKAESLFSTVLSCFRPVRGRLRNMRLFSEWVKVRHNKEMAKKSAEARWSSKRNANALPTQCSSPSPSPSPSPSESDKKEEKKPLRATVTDEQWLEELKKNVAYRHINFPVEFGKMDAWAALPKNLNRQRTRRFILNWLNKIETPMTNGQANRPPPPPPKNDPIGRGQWGKTYGRPEDHGYQ